MDEILYELRDHSAGLNAGRWDYIFSVIKKFRNDPASGAPRPQPGDDDRAVHAGLHRPAGRDLPPARCPRHGGHGGVHPQPHRPRGQRQGVRQGAPGQGARIRRRATTGPGWRTPTWCRWPPRCSTQCSATAPTRSTGQRPDVVRPARPSCGSARLHVPGGTVTGAGVRLNVDVGIRYLGLLAGRQRCRRHPQPDGRRRHRRDLPRPRSGSGSTTASPPSRATSSTPTTCAPSAGETVERLRAEMGDDRSVRACESTRPAGSSSRWRSTPTSPSSSPFPHTKSSRPGACT